MSRFSCLPLLVALLLGAWSHTATAQDTATSVLERLNDIEGKLLGLADTFSDEQLAWRPGEGVRSSSEALMHVAGANYFFPTRLGTAPPEGVDVQNLEANVTEKEAVKATLTASFDHLEAAVAGVEDLDAEIEWFGGSTVTANYVLLFTVEHASEHLGQMIAYARMNGVTPPWSQ